MCFYILRNVSSTGFPTFLEMKNKCRCRSGSKLEKHLKVFRCRLCCVEFDLEWKREALPLNSESNLSGLLEFVNFFIPPLGKADNCSLGDKCCVKGVLQSVCGGIQWDDMEGFSSCVRKLSEVMPQFHFVWSLNFHLEQQIWKNLQQSAIYAVFRHSVKASFRSTEISFSLFGDIFNSTCHVSCLKFL